MARHVTPRHKVVSSGRLTGSGRGQMTRKKVVGRPVHLDPSYSLYSTDSEDQVTTINKGLDRCTALLSDILQAEKSDPKMKSQTSKAAPSKKKTSLVKNEADRKRVGKKASATMRINKRPALVQKTILPSEAYAGLITQPHVHGMQQPPAAAVIGPDVKPGGTLGTQVECLQPHSFPLSSSHTSTGPQPSTVFNCRLTTSTPALSPHRPKSAHSQASRRGADGENYHFTQQFAAAAAAPSTQHRALSAAVSPTQYTASFSVAPSVQLSTVGQFRPSSPVINAPHACSGGQNSAPQSHSAPQICPSPPASARLPAPVPLPTHILVCGSSQDHQLSSGECASSSSEESGDCMSEEDELDRVDTMPVRDTSCQTSIDKHTGMLKHKSGSPEKTARKVMTVKYLLGELKALVANQDSEAVRLISEVEQSISLLPTMVGSTNIQAELALALQPLRSENVQLRRRLRILNQQLQERERAERWARPVDCNLELVSLQSLNLTLQTQLNERHKELENLQQENQKLRQAVEDRENELQQTKEQCELETSRIRTDVSEALAEMRNCQAKLEDCEREKTALNHSLQQKEAEITELQEIIRNLQKSPIPFHLAQTDVSSGSAPAAQLTKSALDQYENQQREPAVASRVTDSVKAYLQTLEDSEHSSPAHPEHGKLSPSSLGQLKRRQKSSPKSSDTVHMSLKNTTAGSVSQEVEKSETAFVPLRETARMQPVAVPQKVQGNGHGGLKYLGLAFNKLGISNGLPSLDDDHGADFLSRPDGVSLQLKQPSEAAVNSAEQSQSQHARRRLHMGETSQRKLANMGLSEEEELKNLVSEKSEETFMEVLSKLKDLLGRKSLGDQKDLEKCKQDLYYNRVLDYCSAALKFNPAKIQGSYSSMTQMADILSTCCVGLGSVRERDVFHRQFLPAVTDSILFLAQRIMNRAIRQDKGRTQMIRLFRNVFNSLSWLLRAHPHLILCVLDSKYYERVQMSDDDEVSAGILTMWYNLFRTNSAAVSEMATKALYTIMDDVVYKMSSSSNPVIGSAAVKILLLITEQKSPSVSLQLYKRYKGLDDMVQKDWRGKGFDAALKQLIHRLQAEDPEKHTQAQYSSEERVRAACVIQAAWRAHQTRCRLKKLPRAVSVLQRSFRERRRQKQAETEKRLAEEELRHQVHLRRQRAIRQFRQRQLHLMEILPAEHLARFLGELENRAALLIQRVWRGHRERRRFEQNRYRLRQHKAAVTLQRAILAFLKRRRSRRNLVAPWKSPKGLTESRRAELKRQIEDHISLHPSSVVSAEGTLALHEKAQSMLRQHLMTRASDRAQEQHRQALTAQINTDIELLLSAPSLKDLRKEDSGLFLSRSTPVAMRARQAHNALLQSTHLPWWKRLGDEFSSPESLSQQDYHVVEFESLYLGGR
ncbi:hypothetical protein QTP86_026846 [Hemibagrus guttatus]|nr:hypothetical protein QTP86_026846 [Hemibagrus guttatus]